MATKYLDDTGLAYFWGKITDYVDTHSGGGSSTIGTVKTEALPSNLTVNNNTNTKLLEISLDKGVWVVACGVRWQSNATGIRKINFTTSQASSEQHLQVPPVNGNTTQMELTRIVQVSADNTPHYLNGMQTSGGQLTANSGGNGYGTYITAVRII